MPDSSVNWLDRVDFLNKLKSSHSPFETRIVIPDIADEIGREFSDLPETKAALETMPFREFGAIIEFKEQVSLPAFDDTYTLHPNLKKLIEKVGVCLFRNVHLPLPVGSKLHKNIFPDRVFHVDRGSNFDNQFSLFYRDPDDPQHRPKRDTSTLIMPNAAYHLQAIKDGVADRAGSLNCELFTKSPVRQVVGKYVLEQRWDAPEGTGELCIFDNRTVLHASHHHLGETTGYPIAVQYLY